MRRGDSLEALCAVLDFVKGAVCLQLVKALLGQTQPSGQDAYEKGIDERSKRPQPKLKPFND